MTAEALAALARKYRVLAGWRAHRDGGPAAATRAELRALAAEFPGCLRELDTLSAAELERRAAACAAAATDPGGGREPARAHALEHAHAFEQWMAWIDGYHALMRAALDLRGGRPPAADVDPAFAAAVLSPPGGRVGVVVLRALGQRFGVPASTIAATLFPVRRPSPYQL